MATIYHNGEYLTSGGGTVASAVPYYYVELTESPSVSNPIILEGADLDKPFKLVVHNNTDNILPLYTGNCWISDGIKFHQFQTILVSPTYRNIDSRQESIANSYAANRTAHTRISPHNTVEYLGFKRSDKYYLKDEGKNYLPLIQGNTHASSTSETMYIYTEEMLSERPKPFILATNDYTWSGTDFTEDGGNNALTVGNIHFSRNISINQMTIFGNITIKSIDVYDVDGNKISGSSIRPALDIPPYTLGFNFSNANTYVSLTILNT